MTLTWADRRNDPVTPLLSQWTYQAMVHELCGITNGRVRIEQEERLELRVRLYEASELFETDVILQDLVLSPTSDPFFSQNIFSNFGDLGAAIAFYVSDYQAKNTTIGSASTSRIETIGDMKRFVEEYPEFRRLGGNVTKHVTLVGELSRLVERDDLLAVSEVEQSLASQESHQADLRVSYITDDVLTGVECYDPSCLAKGTSSEQTPFGHFIRSSISEDARKPNQPSGRFTHHEWYISRTGEFGLCHAQLCWSRYPTR